MQIKLNITLFFEIVMFMTMITGIGSADDVNVEFVDRFGGSVYDAEVVGNYAYLGQGQDLVVLDVTDSNEA
jgi:hypothetical protein